MARVLMELARPILAEQIEMTRLTVFREPAFGGVASSLGRVDTTGGPDGVKGPRVMACPTILAE